MSIRSDFVSYRRQKELKLTKRYVHIYIVSERPSPRGKRERGEEGGVGYNFKKWMRKFGLNYG
jgi:hypothetical protein